MGKYEHSHVILALRSHTVVFLSSTPAINPENAQRIRDRISNTRNLDKVIQHQSYPFNGVCATQRPSQINKYEKSYACSVSATPSSISIFKPLESHIADRLSAPHTLCLAVTFGAADLRFHWTAGLTPRAIELLKAFCP